LILVTYVEIINEAKSKLQIEYEPEKVEEMALFHNSFSRIAISIYAAICDCAIDIFHNLNFVQLLKASA
jgi:hypothetical protein